MNDQKFHILTFVVKNMSFLTLILSIIISINFLSCQEKKRNFEHPEILAEALFKDIQKIKNSADLENIRNIYFPNRIEVMEYMTLSGRGGSVDEVLDRWNWEIRGGINDWLMKIIGYNEYNDLVGKKDSELQEMLQKKIEEGRWDILVNFGAERYNKESLKKLYSDTTIRKKIKKLENEFSSHVEEWKKKNEKKSLDYKINFLHQKIENAKYLGFERGKGKSSKYKYPRIGRSSIKISIDDKKFKLDIDNMDKILESWKITDWD